MTQPLFDENFLNGLRDRDPDAESLFIAHFSRPVQIKLRARLRSPELVRDAQQETFLRVLRYFREGKTLEKPASLPGFVHTVCHNVALELLRGHTRQSQIADNAPEIIDSSPGPEHQFATTEKVELVRRVLAEMSEKDQQLLRRVFLNEEDKDLVCGELHIDRNYLRVLLHRARNRFRAALADDGDSRKFSAGG